MMKVTKTFPLPPQLLFRRFERLAYDKSLKRMPFVTSCLYQAYATR